MRNVLGLPVEASAHAGAFDQILVNVHWLIAVLAVGFGLFFVYCLLRFNRRMQPAARYRSMPPAVAWVVVVAIAVIEVWELFFAAIPLWASRQTDYPPEEQATVVRIVAEQFAWNVHYPGPDRTFGRTDAALIAPDNPLGLDRHDPAARDDVTTINEFYFPVDRPVLVQLTSKDVVHSFSLPQMRVKQDAIPGMMTPVWFVPTMTTPEGQHWEINCSQLCGLGHYRMRGVYSSVSPAAFAAFLRENSTR